MYTVDNILHVLAWMMRWSNTTPVGWLEPMLVRRDFPQNLVMLIERCIYTRCPLLETFLESTNFN